MASTPFGLVVGAANPFYGLEIWKSACDGIDNDDDGQVDEGCIIRTVGGTTQFFVDGSNTNVRPAEGSGSWSTGNAVALAGGAAAVLVILVLGGWYARRVRRTQNFGQPFS